MAFAVSKRLGRAVNEILQQGLSRAAWASIAIRDYQHSASKPLHSAPWFRAMKTYVASRYSPLALSEAELLNAAVKQDLWAKGKSAPAARIKKARNRGTQYPGKRQ